MMPAIRPRRLAPPALTKAHGQVIATKPANMPLHIIEGSGFFVLNHHIHSVAPKAPDPAVRAAAPVAPGIARAARPVTP